MSRISFNEQDTLDILSQYAEGVSLTKLAKIYGVSRDKIKNTLLRHNVHIRSIQETNQFKGEVTEEIKEQIVYNYCVLKMGLQTAGKDFGYSQYMVEKILKERGVQKRTYVEAKQEGRKYTINDNYFKEQSSNMAYILGLLAADGNIAKNENGIFLELHQQDEEVLRKIKQEVNSSRDLDYRTNNSGTPCCKFKVWSAVWKQDLANYGIIPAKTFNLLPPNLLSPKYRIDYIRGFFDGDGSVYLHEGKPYIQIDCASKPQIEWIRNELNNLGISTQGFNIIKLKDGQSFYRLTYASKFAVKQIYKVFYHSDAELFISRKKEIMNKINSL